MTKLIKKEEIRKKIDLINSGKIPEGYKREHGFIVPEDWEITPLKNIVKPVSRPVKKPCEPYWRLGIRSHAKGTFQTFVEDPKIVAMEELYAVKENDLIVNITFAWEHAIAIVKKEDAGLLVSHRFPTFEFKSDSCCCYYKNFIVLSKIKRMLADISPGGAGRNRVLSQKDFVKLNLPKPPIEEQEKIAEILKCCDKVIELKQQLLDEKYKYHSIFARKMLHNKKWPLLELTELLEYEQPSAYIVKNLFKSFQKGTVPVLTANKGFIKGYTDDKIGIFNKCPVIIFDDFTTDNKYVDFSFKVKSSAIKILKSKNKNVNLKYVYKTMQFLKFRNDDHKRYYLSEYQYLPIHIPDIEIQNKVVTEISKFDLEIELLQKELEEYKILKISLMQLLLTGIIRTTNLL